RQFSGEPAVGARPHRPVDAAEPLKGSQPQIDPQNRGRVFMPAKKRAAQSQRPKASRPQAPGYGFPHGNKGLLPWSWAEQLLKKSHNYWITTVKPDGSPHTMVVWGLWQEERLLFSTGSKSQKARNLARNKKCVV